MYKPEQSCALPAVAKQHTITKSKNSFMGFFGEKIIITTTEVMQWAYLVQVLQLYSPTLIHPNMMDS